MDSREKLADWIYKTYLCGGSLPDTKETAQVGADALIAFLKENGWVRLADDQSLPECPFIGCQDFSGPVREIQCQKQQAYARGQQDMIAAKFRKVE